MAGCYVVTWFCGVGFVLIAAGCFGLWLLAVYACDTFGCVAWDCLWVCCWRIALDVGLHVSWLWCLVADCLFSGVCILWFVVFACGCVGMFLLLVGLCCLCLVGWVWFAYLDMLLVGCLGV